MTLKEEAEELLDTILAVHPLGYRPVIQWRKMRVSAGKAFMADGRIVLSTALITDRLRLQDTLVHEFAHLLAYARHGKLGGGHGQPWRQAMKDLGAEPSVYHDYPVDRRPREKNLKYRCRKCGAEFARVKPLKRGYAYAHRGCGGAIERSPAPSGS